MRHSYTHENKLEKSHQADDRDPSTAMSMPTEPDALPFLGGALALVSGAKGRQASAVFQKPVVRIVEKRSSLPRHGIPESEERVEKEPQREWGSRQSRQDAQRLEKTGEKTNFFIVKTKTKE